MSAANNTPAQLERILRQELTLYKEVLNLCKTQKDILLAKNTGDLLHLVSEKQMRINKIEELERLAAPLKMRRENELERWSADERAQVDPLIRKLQDILGEIVVLEDESKMIAQEKTAEGKQSVQKIQTGKAMLNAYGKASKAPNVARYKDKNG